MLQSVYDPQTERRTAWFGWAWLSALYLAGIFLWGKFLNWGTIPFDFHDWAEITAPRVAFLRDAVIKGVLPLHMPDASALRGITDRFMSLPDMLLSPQILLMRFMEVGPFILVNTLIFYTLGVIGLLVLRRRFSLSLASFSVLFFLFNFNGHILGHYSVGHVTWAGYFLFPWLAELTFQLLDGDHSWGWVAKTSLLLFFMYLQGSYHQFIWSVLFLGLLAITTWKHFLPVFKTLVFSILLSMVRILPPVLLLSQFDDEFLGGYPTLWDVLQSLVVVKFPNEALDVRSMLSVLGWWEYDLYLGLAGAAFLFYFGLYRWLKHRNEPLGYPQLLLPIFGIFLLSIGRIYRIVRLLPIPILSGERASIRMIILPVFFLLVLGAVELQKWLKEQPKPPSIPLQISGLGLLLLLVHDLWQHFKAWQVTNAVMAFPVTPVDLSIKVVANHPDPPYIALISAGAAISLASLVVLLFLAWRERRQRPGHA
ncbi:MAG: hypothetical protein GYA17_07060 [Chloroflexi bacterium]|nr:hypothetical protein [Anaerolineaceae bacterium]NMB88101.1 hypothetical protein [Chloroflexota bacterium]